MPHWELLWTKEYCLVRICAFRQQGIAINRSAIKSVEPGLAIKTHRYFGEWGRVIIALGLDPLDECRTAAEKYWTKEEVLRRLKDRANQGKAMNQRAIRGDSVGLHNYTEKYFGNLDNALRAIGLNPLDERKALWTTEKDCEDLMDAMRATSRLYGNKRVEAVKNLHQSRLYTTVVGRHYDRKWSTAAKAAGLDFKVISFGRYPRREDALEGLRERASNEQGLSPGVLVKEDSALLEACRKHYGSHADALRAVDLI